MEKLKQLMKKRGLSVQQTAQELGISRVHLSTILRGKQFPSRKLALRIESWSNYKVRAEETIGCRAKRVKRSISHAQLLNLLDYNPNSGLFIWKHGPQKNKVAGKRNKNGYIVIWVKGVGYPAHRLAWFYTYGYFPENCVDHINRNSIDNRINNLREVNQKCNAQNSKLHYDNTSGIKGVHKSKKQQKWLAQIKTNYKTRHLGSFDDFDEAVCHRLAAEQCLGWDKCNTISTAYRYVQKIIKR